MEKRSPGMRPGRMGGLNIASAGRRASMAESPVLLTGIEHRLIVELSINAGLVMCHDRLPQRVRRPGHAGLRVIYRVDS